jgi:membrane fusion protein, heavy metal efflux system
MANKIEACIATAVILAGAFCGCEKETAQQQEGPSNETGPHIVKLTQQAVREIDLKTEPLARKAFTQTITAPARVLPDQDNEALVGSLVPGRVSKVFVKIGDRVKAGQELMLVEGLEIGEIKSGYLSAKANLEFRKLNCERQKKLFEENIGSQKSYLESQNEFDRARAEFSAGKNRIYAIGLTDSEAVSGADGAGDRNFGSIPVRSPVAGLVVERSVVIGQFIDASTNAFKIVNLLSVCVDGQVYEKDIEKIKVGTQAVFSPSACPGESFYGTVSFTGQVVDEKTRTITIRATFENKPGKLKPQMFGELKIPAGGSGSADLVPAEALVKMDNADFVFIQNADTVFEKRPVTLGAARGELVEITAGVKGGERVVVHGAYYLKAELMKTALGEGE